MCRTATVDDTLRVRRHPSSSRDPTPGLTQLTPTMYSAMKPPLDHAHPVFRFGMSAALVLPKSHSPTEVDKRLGIKRRLQWTQSTSWPISVNRAQPKRAQKDFGAKRDRISLRSVDWKIDIIEVEWLLGCRTVRDTAATHAKARSRISEHRSVVVKRGKNCATHARIKVI